MLNGVRLVPVLVRPCLWQAVPVLEGLQWVHDPERDGPVSDSANHERQIVAACRVLNEMLAVDGAVAPLGVPTLPPTGRVRRCRWRPGSGWGSCMMCHRRRGARCRERSWPGCGRQCWQAGLARWG